jgi:hypothetical protein
MIDIYEYDYKTESWKPYLTDDVQLEFVMMNPYYINQMRLLSTSKPTYYNTFRVRLFEIYFRLLKNSEFLNLLLTINELAILI